MEDLRPHFLPGVILIRYLKNTELVRAKNRRVCVTMMIIIIMLTVMMVVMIMVVQSTDSGECV